MKISSKDREIIRNLAMKYRDVALMDIHRDTIEDWKKLNSLKPTRPMIMIDQIPWHEMNVNDELTLLCENEFLRSFEFGIRTTLYKWKYFPCDMVISPFFQIPKVYTETGIGISTRISQNDILHSEAMTHTYEDQIKDEEDLEKLHFSEIKYDAQATARRKAFMEDLIGDILPVKLSGISIWAAVWDRIVFWRGVTPVLYDLIDRPDFIHKMMEKIISIEMNSLDQYEEQNLLDYEQGTIHCSGAYTYELPASGFNENKIRARDCWVAGAAQIFSEVSPAMHDEFEIQYMKPYYERFGLVYYGCCEPLHNKIDIIRKINNVRLISISPWADVNIAAENMGRDYVMVRKSNPSYLAMNSFDARLVADETEETLKACISNGTPCEFVLKDITTVRNEPDRLAKWYEVVKATIENF
ncbi:MAG TPA: hypothetical protein GX505_09465 [Clostridiales bacterium]|nr:hypothetical protein [Clostridiales bacterium]